MKDIEAMMRRCVEIWQLLDIESAKGARGDLATCERLVAEAERLWARIPNRGKHDRTTV